MYSVLLVDDEPWAIEGLRMFVNWEQLGFHVSGICENGADALSEARRSMPDVIVTDIRMPEMDGLELIRHLLGEGEGASIEFVILSAYGEFELAKRAMQLGVTHYLLKPIIGEEAHEVLMGIRERLDQRSHSLKGGEEEGELPAQAAKRMKDVLQAIEDGNRHRVAEVINLLFEEMNGRPLDWAELFAGSLSLQCGRLIRESGGDPIELLHLPKAMEKLGLSAGLVSVQMRILAFAEHAAGAMQSLRERRMGGVISEIDRYVCDNYRSPLSIRDVAARFYLNPVYLGKAYQDKYGCGLLDRMHDLRIAEACEKLRYTIMPASVVAEQVGYTHYRHFLQHFERRTGQRPSEYRAMKV